MKKYHFKIKALILIIAACLLLGSASIAAANTKASEKLVNYVMGQEYGVPTEPGVWQLQIKDETGAVTQSFRVFPDQGFIVTQNGKKLLYLCISGHAVDKDGKEIGVQFTDEGNIRGLRYCVYDITNYSQPQLLAKGPEIKDGKVLGHNNYPVFLYDSFSFTRLGADLWGWTGVTGKNINDDFTGFVGNFDVIAYKDNKFVNLSLIPAVSVGRDGVYLDFDTSIDDSDTILEYFPVVTEIEMYDFDYEVRYSDKQTTEIKREGDEVYYPNNLKDWPVYFEGISK